MELFNKSKRTFTVSIGEFGSGKNITLSDSEGLALIKQYRDEIIQIGNSVAEKENAELKAKIAELEEKTKDKKSKKYK